MNISFNAIHHETKVQNLYFSLSWIFLKESAETLVSLSGGEAHYLVVACSVYLLTMH